MTVEDAYALATLLAAGGGVLLAAGSFGIIGIAAAVAFAGLVWAGAAMVDSLAVNLLMVAVIGGIGVAHLRLGWLAARHWRWGRALLALASLAALPASGLALLEMFPGSGFIANLGYVLGIYALSLPAAVGFALGLAVAALRLRA